MTGLTILSIESHVQHQMTASLILKGAKWPFRTMQISKKINSAINANLFYTNHLEVPARHKYPEKLKIDSAQEKWLNFTKKNLAVVFND